MAVDGISLTIAGLEQEKFRVAVIPQTMQSTNLAGKQVGEKVNLEADIIAKQVERQVSRHLAAGQAGVTSELLRKSGFLE